MENIITFKRHIKKSEEGTYFEIPLTVPEGVERIDVEYSYPRFRTNKDVQSTTRREVNILDLALNAPGGQYLGCSGSNRSHIHISAYGSSEGYISTLTTSGQWGIIAGAYKIEENGVDVEYKITFTMKHRRLIKGDIHMHTTGSDGGKTISEVIQTAKNIGLDYIFITDHNNFSHNYEVGRVEGITVIPGTEWTCFNGHCGMLGVKNPYRGSFYVNSREEAKEKLRYAAEIGAALVLNHPFCPNCGWRWGFEGFDFDMIEIWNGGTLPKANADCLAWWHKELLKGKKISVIGGSDFHEDNLMRSIGTPSTCLYALSKEPGDIIRALKNGNCYISYVHDGPGVYAEADGSILGETAPKGSTIKAEFFNLHGGDRIRIITDNALDEIICEDGTTDFVIERPVGTSKFFRFEVIRRILEGLPVLPVMISNPIYFE